MLFRQLFDAASSTYTYLLAKAPGHEALIIDPVREQFSLYQQLIAELELELKASLETHTHADHVTAAAQLRKAFNCDIVVNTNSKAEGATRTLEEHEIFSIDGVELTVLLTPGHTDDSCCFLMDDRVFTGDTLLIRGTGRTDFQSGDSLQAYTSITEKLLSLPDDMLVYPGHDYKGMTVSTIGEERRHNPRLQVHSPKEYADIMEHLNLAPPKLIDVAVPANLHCGNEPTK